MANEVVQRMQKARDSIASMEHDTVAETLAEDLKVAIEALEKQQPEQPQLWGDGYSDGELVYDMWNCPRCNKEYEVDSDRYDYCPNCGQRIAWEDDEQ